MPLALYGKCWRDRIDCEPIHCVDGVDRDLTEDEFLNYDYTPDSFVCSGYVQEDSRVIPQDAYRLCFKNRCSDEMSDNDMQDLTSIVSVVSAALNLDAIRKHANGIVELPSSLSLKNKK